MPYVLFSFNRDKAFVNDKIVTIRAIFYCLFQKMCYTIFSNEEVNTMLFDKLDYLMKLTGTSNSQLGRVLSFDPSYISRIRSGKRGIPKNSKFTEEIADYFSRTIDSVYQKKTMAELLFVSAETIDDPIKTKKLLSEWLNTDNPISATIITEQKDFALPEAVTELIETPKTFIGNEGKRNAVLLFLSTICEEGKAVNLLLFSDEDMTWLYENNAFAMQWEALLTKCIRLGCRIKMIHTVTRDMTEMMEGLKKWIPLYNTGAIEPYIYPKLRDGVFHRTMFIAENHSAVLSSSVASSVDGNLNIYVKEQQAVNAVQNEYNDFLALCKPLMNVYMSHKSKEFTVLMNSFYEKKANMLIDHIVPSAHTMPSEMIALLAKKHPSFANYCLETSNNFLALLKDGYFVTEILHLPAPEAVRFCAFGFEINDLLGVQGIVYTTLDMILHLENMLLLAETYPNYKIILAEQPTAGVLMFAKEDVGAVIAKSTAPTTAFVITEPRMSVAIYDYLNATAIPYCNKEANLAKLKEYITSLK